MAKSKFTFGLRIAATANVNAIIDYDERAGITNRWTDYHAGMVFTGKELRRDYGYDLKSKFNNVIYWKRPDDSIVEIANKWSAFKRITATELASRELDNSVKDRNRARNIVLLRVAAVVGAVVYGAATRDIKGAVGIIRIGNQLGDALADGNLSMQELGGLIQSTGEALGVDLEGELRAAMTEAGVSDEDQDELLKPFLADLDQVDSPSLLDDAGWYLPLGSKGGTMSEGDLYLSLRRNRIPLPAPNSGTDIDTDTDTDTDTDIDTESSSVPWLALALPVAVAVALGLLL